MIMRLLCTTFRTCYFLTCFFGHQYRLGDVAPRRVAYLGRGYPPSSRHARQAHARATAMGHAPESSPVDELSAAMLASERLMDSPPTDRGGRPRIPQRPEHRRDRLPVHVQAQAFTKQSFDAGHPLRIRPLPSCFLEKSFFHGKRYRTNKSLCSNQYE